MELELYCVPCEHYRSITGSGFDYVCNYLVDTGEARGCPFGSGCNKRKLTKGGNKENEDQT